MKARCPLCDKVTETTVVYGHKSAYRCCNECLETLLPRELCRIIGHDFLQRGPTEYHSMGRQQAEHWITHYRCTRCGCEHTDKDYRPSWRT